MRANEYRTHYCNELRLEDVGKEVRLAGWVQKIRNLGKMTFVDLRDEFGITQIIISDDENLKSQIVDLKTECAITVTGKVAERSNKNKEIEITFNLSDIFLSRDKMLINPLFKNKIGI